MTASPFALVLVSIIPFILGVVAGLLWGVRIVNDSATRERGANLELSEELENTKEELGRMTANVSNARREGERFSELLDQSRLECDSLDLALKNARTLSHNDHEFYKLIASAVEASEEINRSGDGVYSVDLEIKDDDGSGNGDRVVLSKSDEAN